MARCREYVELRLVVLEGKPFPWRHRFWQYANEHKFNPVRAFLLNPYMLLPYWDKARQRYEENHFFPLVGDDPEYIKCAYAVREPDRGLHHNFLNLGMEVRHTLSVNGKFVLDLLKESQVQLAICYGTGRVWPDVFSIPPMGTINLHGGLLPRYRGLDTNLWAAFEGRPADMGATLHRIDEGLDTGPIYFRERLPRVPDLSAVTLRYHTTVLVTGMVCDLLKLAYQGSLSTPTPMADKGRYYPPMPFLYKPLADWRIRKWAKARPGGVLDSLQLL